MPAYGQNPYSHKGSPPCVRRGVRLTDGVVSAVPPAQMGFHLVTWFSMSAASGLGHAMQVRVESNPVTAADAK